MKYYVMAVVLAIFVSACSSDGEVRHEYLDSRNPAALEIPPQFSQPDTREALKIPKPSSKALQQLAKKEIAEGQVSPLFKNIRLQSEGGFYWLSVDQDADKLWLLLHDFWANEGIKLSRDEPLLGFMETEWIPEYKVAKEGNKVTQWLNSFSADQMDKFRLRLEREAKNKSRIYVSHRGLELQLEEDGTSWQMRPSDAILEREILKRLELFAGLSQAKVNELFDNYKPYQARLRKTDQYNQYEIVGARDFVWRRLQHALDRLAVEPVLQDKAQGIIEVKVAKIDDKLKVDEKDEIAESSWLASLFSSSKEDSKPVTIRMQLDAQDNVTRLTLTLADGSAIKDGLAESFKNSLIALIK